MRELQLVVFELKEPSSVKHYQYVAPRKQTVRCGRSISENDLGLPMVAFETERNSHGSQRDGKQVTGGQNARQTGPLMHTQMLINTLIYTCRVT